MEKPLTDKTLEYIQEQLRTKVLERYAQKQDIENQEIELNASIQALHELTDMPVDDIRTIAKKLLQEYELKHKTKKDKKIPEQKEPESNNYSVDYLSLMLEKNKRNFFQHLVPFVIINTMLFTLNIITSDFPWAMFPFFGWSVGLVSHYLKDIYWTKRDIEIQHRFIKSNTYEILLENITSFKDEPDRIFNGAYRLLMSGCRLSVLEQHLYSCVGENDKHIAENAAYQLIKVRDSFTEQQTELYSSKNHKYHKKKHKYTN